MCPPTIDGEGIMFSDCLSGPAVRPFGLPLEHFCDAMSTKRRDFNETYHEYSSCQYEELKMF